ncbi:MAG: hypothetical protein EOO65_01325 [Methanosarcinales archaeon]|nr:MAG: hypothetical protein EOO65_01325 [Methanosarcinales archaeon]
MYAGGSVGGGERAAPAACCLAPCRRLHARKPACPVRAHARAHAVAYMQEDIDAFLKANATDAESVLQEIGNLTKYARAPCACLRAWTITCSPHPRVDGGPDAMHV